MPYIESDSDTRRRIDAAVETLAETIADVSEDEKAWPGNLNYAMTKLMIRSLVVRFGRIRYYAWAWLSGVVADLYYEFRRRKVDFYEDKKIAENGDVGFDDIEV